MSTTIVTHLDIEIDRPAPTVWSVVADYAADPQWRAGITEMTPDRPGEPTVGTAVHEVLSLGGRTYVTDTVITEVGPGMRYRFAGHGTGGQVRGGREVVPIGEASSRFVYEVEVEPTGLSPLVRPVMAWWMRHSFRRDLRRLRDHVRALS